MDDISVLNMEANANEADVQNQIQNEGNTLFANDPSIPLTLAQQISQGAMQATGQLNSAGTGPGPGFWGTPLGIGLAGGGILLGLYFITRLKGR